MGRRGQMKLSYEFAKLVEIQKVVKKQEPEISILITCEKMYLPTI